MTICNLTRLCLTACAILFTALPASAEKNWWSYQKYWDGKPSPPLQWARGCATPPDIFARDNPDYASPPLMALGDSLYNGVQSLRINWWLSEWSPPNLVAIRMGFITEHAADRQGPRTFYGPQYPRHGGSPDEIVHFGFNLERPGRNSLIGNARDLNSVLGGQRKLLKELRDYRPPNKRAMVDNLAFSGANTRDLLHWTAGEYRALADSALRWMSIPIPFVSFLYLSNAFTYGNAAFVLNPMRDKCLDGMTALQQVELRRPQHLIINIGSNNGLYKVAFKGTSVDDKKVCGSERRMRSASGEPHCVAPIRQFLGEQYRKDMKAIIERLSVVRGLRYVYINNIALPSQVANVILPSETGPYGKNDYGIDIKKGTTVSAKTIEDGDILAGEANEAIKEREGKPGPKFVLVDVHKALDRRDYKKCLFEQNGENCASKRLVVSKKMSGTTSDTFFDNRPMRAEGDSGYLTGNQFASKVKTGGLFSFDNMHLSSIGYEIMAETVHNTMVRTEGKAAWLADFDNNRCVEKNHPRQKFMKPGDCIRLLTQPGWSVADATRRDFVFQRIAGDAEMKSQAFIKALMSFVP